MGHKTNELPYVFNWKYADPGEYEIIVSAKDEKGAIGHSKPLKIKVESSNYNEKNILEEEKTIKNEFNISYGPNPSKYYIIVDFKHPENGILKFSISNILGSTFF